MSQGPVVGVRVHDEGAIVQLELDRPKGNILDSEMVEALRGALRGQAARPEVRALLIQGAGAHFSFGASVEEHAPGRVGAMLAGFHALFRELIALERPVLTAVRGQCLGGGLELAAFSQRVFATPHARLGQPEIRLGVFAPVASLILPRRIGQAAADDLLLSGRTVEGHEAERLGLVDEMVDDPTAAALAYARAHVLPHSAASLAVATSAARFELERAFLAHIDAVEALYLERLMGLRDAEEGIRAFLEKREPAWSHA